MRVSLVLLFLYSLRLAISCECVLPSVKAEAKRSGIVFRGLITEINDRQIIFAVQRVFKGRIAARFLCQSSFWTGIACPGFAEGWSRLETSFWYTPGGQNISPKAS